MPKPPQDPSAQRSKQPSDELVLAALERALLHRAEPGSPAPIWSILEHLCIPRRGAGARHVKSVLRLALQMGRVESSRPHGVEAWQLTRAGRAHLRRLRSADSMPTLPESPQHRDWRNARAAAAQEVERFERRLGEHLDEGTRFLARDRPVSSDEWFLLAEAIRRDCRRLGSAYHCLYEWSEPRDELSDHDSRRDPEDPRLEPAEQNRRIALRQGRRNIRLWREDG
jgi:hypothetical protein